MATVGGVEGKEGVEASVAKAGGKEVTKVAKVVTPALAPQEEPAAAAVEALVETGTRDGDTDPPRAGHNFAYKCLPNW